MVDERRRKRISCAHRIDNLNVKPCMFVALGWTHEQASSIAACDANELQTETLYKLPRTR